jgi:hypothetical protein
VTSGLSVPVVQPGPEHPKVVHPSGSRCGSQPYAPPTRLVGFKSVRDSPPAPTWTFSMSASYVIQDLHVGIDGGLRLGPGHVRVAARRGPYRAVQTVIIAT